MYIWGLYRVEGLGLRFRAPGFETSSLGFKILGLGFTIRISSGPSYKYRIIDSHESIDCNVEA